eukprot:Nitzschia sp. Nitz4//scaffold141_size107518//9546//13339//NITZ4_004263-RA/size107518-snap-gene-0.187-mRNA-1//-1//CDS//3329536249//4141//frame0
MESIPTPSSQPPEPRLFSSLGAWLQTWRKPEQSEHPTTQVNYGSCPPNSEDTFVDEVDEQTEESSDNELDVEDAMELLGMGAFQLRILVAAGLCFAADAMEVLMLSFLSVVLAEEWGLDPNQNAALISVAFLGALLGTLVLNPLGDAIGRRPVFSVTAAVIAIFGIGTAMCKTYSWLLFSRFMVGFGIGGLVVPFDTLAEFLPSKYRGPNLLYIEFFWTAGTLLVPAFAWISFGGARDSWQLFCVLCALPCLVSTILGIMLVPESPRWLLTVGKEREALEILRTAAVCNGKDPDELFPEGTILFQSEIEKHGNICDLFTRKWIRKTLLLWVAWFGLAFLYNGAILAISFVFTTVTPAGHGKAGGYEFDYQAIFISGSAEIVGLLMVIAVVDRWGRILTQFLCYLLGGICCLMLGVAAFRDAPRTLLVLFSFFVRFLMMGATCTTWVTTSELLTTDIRATGHGTANAVGRIGGFLCPYVISLNAPLNMIGFFLFTVSMCTAVAVWFLPETAGKRLGDELHNAHTCEEINTKHHRSLQRLKMEPSRDQLELTSVGNLWQAWTNPKPPSQPTTPTEYGTAVPKGEGSQALSHGKMPREELDVEDAMERLGMGPFQFQILVAAGLCFAADAMEVLLLSFLSVILTAEWGLESNENETLISVVFLGAMLGTMTLSPLGDIVGRRPVFSLTAAIIAIFGMGTALCSSYISLLFSRFMVGFGVGGLVVPFDTLAEFLPSRYRGPNLLYIEFFWTGGTMLVPVLAWFSLGNSNEGGAGSWQLFCILCAIPCIISTVLGIFLVPESPRWLLTVGRDEEALQILRRAAVRNGKDPMELFPLGTKLVQSEIQAHENIFDLFSPKWLRKTLLLWAAWFGLAFLYYGAILSVSIVFTKVEQGGNGNEGAYEFDYQAIFISASSEIAGLFLVLFTIDRWGRIPTQTFTYFMGGVCCLLLGLAAYHDAPRPLLVSLSFCARLMMMGATCTTWVSTSEILTTDIRATGHGAANAMGRIGGFFCPYVISENTPLNLIGLSLFVVSCGAALVVSFLPETAGKKLGEDDQPNERGTTSEGINYQSF